MRNYLPKLLHLLSSLRHRAVVRLSLLAIPSVVISSGIATPASGAPILMTTENGSSNNAKAATLGHTVTQMSLAAIAVETPSALAAYKAIFLSPGFSNYAPLRSGVAANGALERYVYNGGVVVLNVGSNYGNQTDIAPGGVDYVLSYNQAETFAAPSHPYLTGAGFAGSALTVGEFNSWGYTDHGSLAGLPEGATTVLRNGNGPTWIEYAWGSGRVIVTSLTYGWGVGGGRGNPQSNLINYALSLAAPTTVPEIAVYNGDGTGGTERTDNTGTHTFATLNVGSSSATQTFTVQNKGTGDLTGLALTTTGHSSDFTLGALGATTLAPDGTTTFTVGFTPSASGARAAVIKIASNDGDENPFEINVAGNATAPVSFSSSTYAVNQGATTVALTLTRTDGAAAASVSLNTNNGVSGGVPFFAAALANTDYIDLAGAATTVNFGIGETSKTVNVTLVPKTAATTPNKRFTAVIAAPAGAASLGSVTSANIDIHGVDTLAPTVLVYGPTAAAVLSVAQPYRAYGVVGDYRGISKVELVLNGGPPVSAVLGASVSSAALPWSLNIAPVNGPNTLTVTAFDLVGNSASVTRAFTYTRRYTLSLGRTAPAGVALDAAGTVAVATSPSTAASLLTPITANASPKTSDIVPAATVNVTATAKAPYIFSHWTGAPAGASLKGNVISFAMPAANVSGLTAHFVANPFGSGASNVFYGLIHASGGTPVSNATEGFLTGTFAPATGLFTGSIRINGLTSSFVATFQGDGSSVFTVAGAKQPSLAVGGSSLTLTNVSGAIHATVTNGIATSTGTATRALYSATSRVPAALLNSATSGLFTIGFPAREQTPAADATTYPQGDGFATLTLKDNGTLTLSGTLADGTTVTGSSALVAGDVSPVLVQLATPGAAATAKGGSLSGILTFDTTQPDSDVTAATDLLWIRPAVSEQPGTTGVNLATQLYTAGWPNGIRVGAIGAHYNSAITVQNSLGLSAVDATNGNAQLELADGKLSEPITKTKFNISGNTVAKIPATDASYTLTALAATGAFSGTFTPDWTASAKPAFKGILIQKGLNKGGYGYFLSNATGDLNPESGGVTLGAPAR
ncbi:MAG TPA: choice-of-anchor D domain-containing protein [Prosthecobacter sp.]|nr:choice-of-anchor D domain-containing protein [Prosthecobacter sp.]